jgi:hypothetical protein
MGPPLRRVRNSIFLYIPHAIYFSWWRSLTDSGSCYRIQSHPSVDFIIVINPASGPGVTPLPDENYTREITRLNSFPNVRTIGYVAVQYGRKVIQTAFEEVTQYAAWSEQNKDLAMQGIFLDESPQIADEHNSTFLDQLQQHIKNQKELSGGLLGKLFFVASLTPHGSPCVRFPPIFGPHYSRNYSVRDEN